MEGALQFGERLAARQALDRRHAAALNLGERREAGADLAPVDEHRAGAAVARVAANLGAGEAELVAQHVGQARNRRGRRAHRATVQRERRHLSREIGARAVHARAPSSFRQRATSVCAASRR